METIIVPALQSALSQASLLRADACLLAAVSGGADSVALLYGLHSLQQQIGFSLHCVHVEHGLRGQSSLEDAAFVQDLCNQLGIPLLLYRAQLAGGMEAAGAEERARNARLRFFREAIASCQGDALLLAHHQDDQAETLLLHLLRGAGAKGLSCMQASQPFEGGLLLRPFLELPRQALRHSLENNGLRWREDESNASPCTRRNNLRLSLFPLLEDMQPHASAHIAQAAQRLAWDEECLHQLAQEKLALARVPLTGCVALAEAPLLSLPQAILLRVLRQWYGAYALPLSTGAGERTLSYRDTLALKALLAEPSGSLNLPRGYQALKTPGYLHLQRQGGEPLLPLPEAHPLYLRASHAAQGQAYTLGETHFRLEPMAPDAPPCDGRSALSLSNALLSSGPILRYPEPGDQFHSFGAVGSKPLRRYLTDRKVATPFRRAWPILALGSQVLWVPGISASEATRVQQAHAPLWALRLETALPHPLSPDQQKQEDFT